MPQLWRRVAEFVAGVHVAAVTVVPLPAPTPDHVGVGRDLGADALPEDSMVEGPDGGLLLLVDESEGSGLAKGFEAPSTCVHIAHQILKKAQPVLSNVPAGSHTSPLVVL